MSGSDQRLSRKLGWFVVLVLALSPLAAGAQRLECQRAGVATTITSEMMRECPSRLSFGMDAALLFLKPDVDGAETTKAVAIPTQVARFDYMASDHLRFEVPFSFNYSKTEDDPSVSSLTTGLIADYCARNLGDSYAQIANYRPQCRFFAGIGSTIHHESFNDSSDTRLGVLGRVGIEHNLLGMDGRLALLFEHRFEKDDNPGENVFGVSYGVGFPIGILGEPYTGYVGRGGMPTPFHLRFGAEFSREMPSDDGAETTTIEAPAPYVGFFITPDAGRQFGIGANTSFQWASLNDASIRRFMINPRIEFSPTGNYLTRSGFRVGAQFLIENVHVDPGFPGVSSISRAQYGFGGDVHYTIPCWPRNPSVFRIGVGFDHLLENSDDNIPSANVVRVSVGVDRFGLRYGF